ncbi:hypothetical protein WOLCODRAFT_165961 [Wolfiporia cocos MD-104 SS10]|uniref:DUF6699 domain-containing protein n=1 Tax=Wolfiporia cocos (strain MD-104) TaxID=742152 RepID=A0A2H3JBH4_WOLCO|nr:hypothetical protein WOLCODRAFT_165961 [Wolfiporia cocos MD-104 SS10]
MANMSSYLRNLFGGSNTSPTSGTAKSSSRTSSSGPVPEVYAPVVNGGDLQRSYSYSVSHTPKPTSTHYSTPARARTQSGHVKRSETSPYATGPPAYSTTQEAGNYPSHAPKVSFITPTSSRSNSNASLHGSVPSIPSSDARHYNVSAHIRPSLQQRQHSHHSSSVTSMSSYGSTSGQPPSYPNPYSHLKVSCLHMHPILAHTRTHNAPLTYDVILPPSAHTVLDCETHSAIPTHTLMQPATDPPMPLGARLVLSSHKLPWPIIVTASNTGPVSPGPRFTIGPPKPDSVITNLDVLYGVHITLLKPVTPEEWAALGVGSRAQQKVARAYQMRCTRMGGGWEAGVRRVDWLGEKTRLVGVEVDKSGGDCGSGKLVFSR